MALKQRGRHEKIIAEMKKKRQAKREDAMEKGYAVDSQDKLHCVTHPKALTIKVSDDYTGIFCKECVRAYLEKYLNEEKQALKSGIMPFGRNHYERVIKDCEEGLSNLDRDIPLTSGTGRLLYGGDLNALGYKCNWCELIVKGMPYREEHYRQTHDALSGSEGTTYNCGVCGREVGTCGIMTYFHD
jgi:hypothetical protein